MTSDSSENQMNREGLHIRTNENLCSVGWVPVVPWWEDDDE